MLRAPRFPVVVCVAKSSGDSLPHGPFPPPFRLSKPTWVVKTESNVWKEKVEKPEPPCVICHGTGRVRCQRCQGKGSMSGFVQIVAAVPKPSTANCKEVNHERFKSGRTNMVHLSMLPKGEWPKWCSACGGIGLSYCSRCLGTGEYREAMGFHFMKMHGNSARVQHESDHSQ